MDLLDHPRFVALDRIAIVFVRTDDRKSVRLWILHEITKISIRNAQNMIKTQSSIPGKWSEDLKTHIVGILKMLARVRLSLCFVYFAHIEQVLL